jgi:hypothetical protein
VQPEPELAASSGLRNCSGWRTRASRTAPAKVFTTLDSSQISLANDMNYKALAKIVAFFVHKKRGLRTKAIMA